MRFVIIRHGQSTNNLLWEETGESVGRHHDSPLTDLGRTQAERLAAFVADGGLPWSITQIHASLMSRAIQTAAPLADALDLPLHGHVDAHELGGTFIEADDGVRTLHPGAPATELRGLTTRLVLPPSATDDGWFAGPVDDGDTVAAERARRLVAGLREQHSDDDVVAVVTHGAFFQHLFRALLGIGEMTGWVRKNNTAISLFADYPDPAVPHVSAHAINWLPHLTPAQITY